MKQHFIPTICNCLQLARQAYAITMQVTGPGLNEGESIAVCATHHPHILDAWKRLLQ
jgi:hypothetical protein